MSRVCHVCVCVCVSVCVCTSGARGDLRAPSYSKFYQNCPISLEVQGAAKSARGDLGAPNSARGDFLALVKSVHCP